MKSALLVVVALSLAACGKGADKTPAADNVEAKPGDKPSETAPADAKVHFDFTVDGKPFSIAAGDISSTYSDALDPPVFKIFAGADGAVAINLTVNRPMTGPSKTPNGSPTENDIKQGSVSLQNFPEKNYTTNSFNTADPAMSVVVPDAVVITEITADGKDAKFVSGTFSAKTFGSHSKDADPKDTDHEVKGSFRIRHEMGSARF